LIAGGFNGLDRGFSEFHETWKEHGSRGDVFGGALPPWFERNRDRRFFAYVHFREPHCPYNPPPPFDTRFGPDGPIPASARGDCNWVTDVNQGRRPLTAEERDHIVRLYDGNLSLADDVMGSLRQALEKDGLWERTVVVVTGDHGESMREHGWIGHNTQVYDESVHVPLVVRFPSGTGPSGVRVAAMADLLDVGPTIADVMGVLGRAGSDHAFQGRSLLPVLFGAAGEPSVLSRTVWDRPVYAWRDARFKLIFDTRTGEEQLYDLTSDPGETKNVAAAEPLRAAWARQALHHWIAEVGRSAAPAPEAPHLWTREECESLKSLGYLDSRTKCPER
jgi:arylsulfatase A-like enzyme